MSGLGQQLTPLPLQPEAFRVNATILAKWDIVLMTAPIPDAEAEVAVTADEEVGVAEGVMEVAAVAVAAETDVVEPNLSGPLQGNGNPTPRCSTT